jgi:hypothetical protein
LLDLPEAYQASLPFVIVTPGEFLERKGLE